LRALVNEHTAAECATILSAEFPGTPRTATAVLLRAKRRGMSRPGSGTYTAQQLGRLFGVDPSTVSKSWIRRGWLAGGRLTDRPGAALCVTAAALEQFIRNSPHVYDWRVMPVSRWRSLAEMVWRRDPLLTVAEAARATGISVATLRNHLARGWLVGRRRFQPGGARLGCWIIPRSALRQFAYRRPELVGCSGRPTLRRSA
jgi:hypothetical protein